MSSALFPEALPPDDSVLPLREASRKLVREWGFLQPTFTPFPLSPAAVHCLIEIGDYGRRAFPELCAELRVTPTQLAHALTELVSSGAIKKCPVPQNQDGDAAAEHEESYCLTAAGVQTLSEINTYAQEQVTKALAAAPPGAGSNITEAFRAYAAALEQTRLGQTNPTLAITPAATPEPPVWPSISIIPGYRPGILARTLEMHLDFYYQTEGWGREFEAALSKGLGDLLARLDKPVNQVWSAILRNPAQDSKAPPMERIVGVVYVDGEYYGKGDIARLRCFIVDTSTRGMGVGKQLLRAAMGFVREKGFRQCQLTTMRKLNAARRLYEREGFKEAGEQWFEGFGKGVMELTYVWNRPDDA
ncbi:hypothetical protein VTI74DRAFT_8460 [Chaetomium olivicolor]